MIFLTLVVALYWRLDQRRRLYLLFATSLVFYGFWRWDFIPVMLASTVIDYVAAGRIQASKDEGRRKAWVAISLVGNLGLLCFFKYAYFILGNVNGIGAAFGFEEISLPWTIILPIGISFYTFQSISYTIDVYRGYTEARRDFVLFATYVTLFPQLVAGPILRSNEVMWQLETPRQFQATDLSAGLWLILSGLFLKVVVADNIAGLVDAGFLAPPETFSALDVWVLAFLFGFQIYFDFSAYSHIAIGSARLLGLRFPKNFDFPYFAASPREFWQRWHISLSSWIRDYLYLPLQGVRAGDRSVGGLRRTETHDLISGPRRTGSLILTWAIMGLWHGANWTFVVWGLWHAALVLLHRLWTAMVSSQGGAWRRVIGWTISLPLVMLGWIPFRAETLEDSWQMMRLTLDPSAYLNWHLIGGDYLWAVLPINIDPKAYLWCALIFLGHVFVWTVQCHVLPRATEGHWAVVVARGLYASVLAALVFIFLQPTHQFIYFQF